MPEKESASHVCTHIAFKQIELEGPGWSGVEFDTKPDQPVVSSSIHLEV